MVTFDWTLTVITSCQITIRAHNS